MCSSYYFAFDVPCLFDILPSITVDSQVFIFISTFNKCIFIPLKVLNDTSLSPSPSSCSATRRSGSVCPAFCPTWTDPRCIQGPWCRLGSCTSCHLRWWPGQDAARRSNTHFKTWYVFNEIWCHLMVRERTASVLMWKSPCFWLFFFFLDLTAFFNKAYWILCTLCV